MKRKPYKYSEELRDKIKYLKSRGFPNQMIAEEVGIPRRSVDYILWYKKSEESDVPSCPFCGSKKTRLSKEYADYPGCKGYYKYYAACNSCHARGPTVNYLHDRGISESEVKKQALHRWENLVR